MKKLLCLVLALALVFSFAACQDKDAQSETEGAEATEVMAEKTPEPAEEVEPIEITYTAWVSEEEILQNVIDEFETVYPNIKVNLVVYPDADYSTTLTVSLAGGGDIDGFSIKDNELFSDLAFKGLTLPLDDYVKADKYDVAPYGPLYDAAVIDGELQALPYRKAVWVLYYNKDLFDAAGVDYPSDDMTWDEFAEKAKELTSGEGNDKIWGTYVHSWVSCLVAPGLQTGSSVVDDDLSAFEYALELRMKLQDDGSTMPYAEQTATSAHYKELFIKGKVAMHYMGDWHIEQLISAGDEVGFDWDIAAMPHPDGVSANTAIGNPTNAGISSRTTEEKQDAAWKFISYLCGYEGQKNLASQKLLTAYTHPDITEAYLGEGEVIPANLKIIMEQKVYPESPIVEGVNYIINTIYKEEFELALIGEQSVEDTFANIKERIATELD